MKHCIGEVDVVIIKGIDGRNNKDNYMEQCLTLIIGSGNNLRKNHNIKHKYKLST